VKDNTTRNDMYDAKTVAAVVSLKVASQLGVMKPSFASKCQSFTAKEILVQGNLIQTGTPTIQYPFYFNYGREIWGLHERGISGPALIGMTVSLQTKYVAFGLDASLLKLIADDVFSVTIP